MIVERTGLALIQVQRALKRLELSGLIEKKKWGHRSYYIANKSHPAFEDIKRALLKTVLLGDVVKEDLKSIGDEVKYGFIYGSVASGNENASSDIDLLIIGDLGIKDVAVLIGETSRKLGREINPTIYSEREFRKKIEEENTFVNEVIGKPKIWLMGNENEFKRLRQ